MSGCPGFIGGALHYAGPRRIRSDAKYRTGQRPARKRKAGLLRAQRAPHPFKADQDPHPSHETEACRIDGLAMQADMPAGRAD